MKAFSADWRRAAIFALGFGALCAAASAAPPQSWTHFGYDAAHTFFNPNETQLNPSTVKQMQLLWGKRNGLNRTTTLSGPLYLGGTLAVCATFNGMIALNARTGELLKGSFDMAGARCEAPALYRDTVVSASYILEPFSGQMLAYSLAGEKWTVPTPTTRTLNDAAVYGDRVFVSERGDQVYAYNANTGAEASRRQTGWTNSSVSVASGKVIFYTWASEPGTLYALDTATGRPVWTAPATTGLTGRPPLISAGKVVNVAYSGWVSTNDLETGAALWTAQLDEDHIPALASDGATLFVSGRPHVSALNIDTGAVLWAGGLRSTEQVSSNLVVANGVLYYTVLPDQESITQYLLATDAATGKVLARFNEQELEGSSADVIVADGLVQIATRNGKGFIYVYGLRP